MRTKRGVSPSNRQKRAERGGGLYGSAGICRPDRSHQNPAVPHGVSLSGRRLKQLQTPAFFETWITRILINTCQDELRRRRRFHPGGADALPDTAGPDDYEHLPLREAIRRLPEELRSVVILRFFSGYTQAETAAALNIPQGTAATRQKRALALLKLELGEEGQA